MIFKKLGAKEDLCIAGVCVASYKNDNRSVSGKIIMCKNKKTMDVSLIY